MGFDWVWLSFVPWAGRRNRCHHLVAALGPGHRVAWVDPPAPGGRRDVAPREVAPGVWLVAAPGPAVVAPLAQGPWGEALRAAIGAWRRPGVPLVAMVEVPVLFHAALVVGADLVVYDALDDWRHAGDAGALRVEVAERVLAREAGLVLAVSEQVRARFDALGARPELLENACRVEDWAQVDATPPAPALRDLPRPRLLFFGGLHPETLDVDALEAAAAALPGAWVLVGPCGDAGLAVRLRRLPGAALLGPCAYGDLPGLVAGADACVLPLRLTPFNQGRDCLKLYEYLASGRPVATAPLPQAERFADLVERYDPARPASLADACRRALADTDCARRAARVAAAREHTWARRAARLEALVRARLG